MTSKAQDDILYISSYIPLMEQMAKSGDVLSKPITSTVHSC